MIIGTNILIMPVLHEKASRNHAELLKAQTLIEMSGMDIGAHNGVKLENSKAMSLSLSQTVQDKLLADMKPSCLGAHSVACIGDMAAASLVVGMKNIKSQNLNGIGILRDAALRNAAVGLSIKECRACSLS